MSVVAIGNIHGQGELLLERLHTLEEAAHKETPPKKRETARKETVPKVGWEPEPKRAPTPPVAVGWFESAPEWQTEPLSRPRVPPLPTPAAPHHRAPTQHSGRMS